MKIAIVHDWLVTYAGAERVLKEIAALYPAADLFAVVDFLAEEDRRLIAGDRPIRTSWVQKLPKAKNQYRKYLPLMPRAMEGLDVSGYDLVISSSHAVAKGIRTRPDQLHVCYCHTPMRYAWDLREQYLSETGLSSGIKGWSARMMLERMRKWDLANSQRVDRFVANSGYIAERISRSYGREALVVHPPVDVDGFALQVEKEKFYLTASRMVPYKRLDVIVEAFAALPDRQLVVIGDGPDMNKVKRVAAANVHLLGWQSSEVLRDYMQRAQAFIFAAEEDFGITPVEAQACGTPVIAFGRGGALETVRRLDGEEPPTGLFFSAQKPEAVVAAVHQFEINEHRFLAQVCRENALRFSREHFRERFATVVEDALRRQ